MRKVLYFVYVFLLLGCLSRTALANSYVTATNTSDFANPQKTQVYVSTATGSSKGTVVLLHAFIIIAPEIYQHLIEDMTSRGYDVIYPYFQEAGLGIWKSIDLLGLIGLKWTSVNHDTWTNNACQGIRWALNHSLAYEHDSAHVSRQPSDHLVVFGHSIGGAIGYNIASRCPDIGRKIDGLLMANAILDPTKMIEAQSSSLPIPAPQTINLKYAGPFNKFPILFLTGEHDHWGTPAQGQDFLDAAVYSSDKKIMMALGPDANHLAPTTDAGPAGELLAHFGVMETLGGNIELNRMDTDYYTPAILHLLSGGSPRTFVPSLEAL